MFPHSSFQTDGKPGPRTVSLDLPGLFKHPLDRLLFVLLVSGACSYRTLCDAEDTQQTPLRAIR